MERSAVLSGHRHPGQLRKKELNTGRVPHSVRTSDLNGYPDIRVPEPWIFTRNRNNIPEYPNLRIIAVNIAHAGWPSTDISSLHKFTKGLNFSIKMHKNIVFSPLYTIYSILFVVNFGCLYIVKCRDPLKIVSLSKQILNSEPIKHCILVILWHALLK